MEKPFCIGDSIAREIISENPQSFLPALDVENEINLALTSNKAFQNNATQKMKDLGLERYLLACFFFNFFSLLNVNSQETNSEYYISLAFLMDKKMKI